MQGLVKEIRALGQMRLCEAVREYRIAERAAAQGNRTVAVARCVSALKLLEQWVNERVTRVSATGIVEPQFAGEVANALHQAQANQAERKWDHWRAAWLQATGEYVSLSNEGQAVVIAFAPDNVITEDLPAELTQEAIRQLIGEIRGHP
jgi:hypothetical protein